jgi:hypothetical protein
VTPARAASIATRLTVTCETCHAIAGEPCRNYKGQRCHPHGTRKPAAPKPAAAVAQPQPAAAPKPAVVRPIRNHDTKETAKRPANNELAEAIAALVAKHGCGCVIDAAWEANTARWQKAGAQR